MFNYALYNKNQELEIKIFSLTEFIHTELQLFISWGNTYM